MYVYVNYNLLQRYNVYVEILYNNMYLGRWPDISQSNYITLYLLGGHYNAIIARALSGVYYIVYLNLKQLGDLANVPRVHIKVSKK